MLDQLFAATREVAGRWTAEAAERRRISATDPMDLEWARSVRDQCVAAGVPFFFKQAADRFPGQPSGDPELDRWKDPAPFLSPVRSDA